MLPTGVSGHVDMDDEADRSPNYWLWHFHGTEAEFQHFADVRMLSHEPKVRSKDSIRKNKGLTLILGCAQL